MALWWLHKSSVRVRWNYFKNFKFRNTPKQKLLWCIDGNDIFVEQFYSSIGISLKKKLLLTDKKFSKKNMQDKFFNVVWTLKSIVVVTYFYRCFSLYTTEFLKIHHYILHSSYIHITVGFINDLGLRNELVAKLTIILWSF